MSKSDKDDMGTHLRQEFNTSQICTHHSTPSTRCAIMKRIMYRKDNAERSANLKLNAKKTNVIQVNGS